VINDPPGEYVSEMKLKGNGASLVLRCRMLFNKKTRLNLTSSVFIKGKVENYLYIIKLIEKVPIVVPKLTDRT